MNEISIDIFRQPDFENKANYCRYVIPPQNPLYGIVYDIFFLHGARGYKDSATVIPIIFKSLEICFIKSPEYINFYGSISKLTNIDFDETDSLVINFFPWIKLNFGSKEAPISDHHVDYTHIINEYYADIKRISEAKKFTEMLSICMDFLCKLLAKHIEISSPISTSAQYIIHQNTNYAINQLAKNTGYSSRQIQRIFKKEIGYSPNYCAEIIRFQKSIHTLLSLPEKKHSDIAWDHGYYDLSHMNKSYKKLTTCTVKQLLHKLSSCDPIS